MSSVSKGNYQAPWNDTLKHSSIKFPGHYEGITNSQLTICKSVGYYHFIRFELNNLECHLD